MEKVKTVALIAHDNKKAEMVSWSMKNKSALEKFSLCGTGTTAGLVADATGLNVTRYLSGPLGGDQQIGAKIAERVIDAVIFSGTRCRRNPTTPTSRHFCVSPWCMTFPLPRTKPLPIVS